MTLHSFCGTPMCSILTQIQSAHISLQFRFFFFGTSKGHHDRVLGYEPASYVAVGCFSVRPVPVCANFSVRRAPSNVRGVDFLQCQLVILLSFFLHLSQGKTIMMKKKESRLSGDQISTADIGKSTPIRGIGSPY